MSDDANAAMRARLVRYLTRCNPAKLSDVDAIVRKYDGRETELFDALQKAVGSEPEELSLPLAVASHPVQSSTAYRERLTRFYLHYCPDKLDSIDLALQRYSGKEETLFVLLTQRYGPEGNIRASDKLPGGTVHPAEASDCPRVPLDHRARLIRFYERYAPEKLENVDRALDHYFGEEEYMFELLVQKYGPEGNIRAGHKLPGGTVCPAEATDCPRVPLDHRARLIRFYERYAPEKLENVDGALDHYFGEEEYMFELLVRKYGPEGDIRASDKLPGGYPAEASDCPRVPLDHRARLILFYERYAPEKLENVDRALDHYFGEEEYMFELLVRKYGPEPH